MLSSSLGEAASTTILGRGNIHRQNGPSTFELDPKPGRLLGRTRTLETTSFFDFDLVYHDGVKHQAADALSRMPTHGLDDNHVEDYIPCFAMGPSGNSDCIIATVQEEEDVFENVMLD